MADCGNFDVVPKADPLEAPQTFKKRPYFFSFAFVSILLFISCLSGGFFSWLFFMHSFRDNSSGAGENSATNSEALTAHLHDENKLGELLQRGHLESSKAQGMTMDYEQTVAPLNESKTKFAAHRVALAKAQKKLKDMTMKYEQTAAALEKSKADLNAHRETLASTQEQLKIMNGRYEDARAIEDHELDAKKSKLEAFNAKEPNMPSRKHLNFIKLFGERNSGTRFLNLLMTKNIKEWSPTTTILGTLYKDAGGWKHGFFYEENFDNFGIDPKNVLFVCIIRELRSWLKSMYHHNYGFVNPKKKHQIFKDFITKRPIWKDEHGRKDHPVEVDPQERADTFVQLRHEKYENYKFLCETYNCILTRLSYVQNHTEEFLDIFQSQFGIDISPIYKPVLKNTKTRKKEVNEIYEDEITEEVEAILESFMENTLEQEIEQLTVEVFKN